MSVLPEVTEIRRLGRGQSIGLRCDKFNAPPPQVSEASSLNQPFNVVNVRGLSDTHRHWHSKLRRGRIGFFPPLTYTPPPPQPRHSVTWVKIPVLLNFFSALLRGRPP